MYIYMRIYIYIYMHTYTYTYVRETILYYFVSTYKATIKKYHCAAEKPDDCGLVM